MEGARRRSHPPVEGRAGNGRFLLAVVAKMAETGHLNMLIRETPLAAGTQSDVGSAFFAFLAVKY